ncbi:hypothetical protein E2C01_081049 [Portunus trituberculatus]|uniref:Uncharacterized protein n=1 Tax=Portunus trituberculatus TaxID=210409 RepID=A0A5B7J011_PORTR|nr:hypothetical protein [Portunus trituberculatus]
MASGAGQPLTVTQVQARLLSFRQGNTRAARRYEHDCIVCGGATTTPSRGGRPRTDAPRGHALRPPRLASPCLAARASQVAAVRAGPGTS